MNISNSVVLVTGSADRVGKAIALLLARKGAKIVVQYHTKREKAAKTAEEISLIGHPPLVVQGDISSQRDWRQMVGKILKKFSKIDVLVNNAAIFYKTSFFSTTEDQWNQFMTVNLKGAFLGSQIVGELMVKQKRGKIINLGDVASDSVWPNYIPYCISKAGIAALTKGLAKALAPHVTVNTISPGTILLADTYDAEEEQALIDKTPLKRIGKPEDIAAAAAFFIEGSDFISGTQIIVDGGRSIV